MQFLPKGLSNNNKINVFYFVLAFILIFFAAIRKVGVGTDSGNYVDIFNQLLNVFENGFTATGSLEIGYLFLNYLVLMVSDEYFMLFAAIAFVSVILYFITFKHKSKNLRISIFIFLTSAIYLFSFNGARQGIAAAFVALAISNALDNKLKHFLIYVIIGVLFHKTAVIVLPFYYLMNIPFSMRNLVLLILISFLPINYLSEILSVADEDSKGRYMAYVNRGATGGLLLTIFFIINNAFLIFFRKDISKFNLKFYDKLLFLANIHTIIYLVVTITGKDINLVRFSIYFSIAFPLIWSLIFQDTRTFRKGFPKVIVYFAYICFYYVYLDKMSNLTPYKLNESIW